MGIQNNCRVVISILYIKRRHTGYYLGNKFRKNIVQNYLLPREAQQIHRLESSLSDVKFRTPTFPESWAIFSRKCFI